MTETPATEPVVNVNEYAAAAVKSLLAQPENVGKRLRIFVEQGGCSGIQYGMVFDEKRDGDFPAEQHGVRVLVEAFGAKYWHGRGFQRRPNRRRSQNFQSQRQAELRLRKIL